MPGTSVICDSKAFDQRFRVTKHARSLYSRLVRARPCHVTAAVLYTERARYPVMCPNKTEGCRNGGQRPIERRHNRRQLRRGWYTANGSFEMCTNEFVFYTLNVTRGHPVTYLNGVRRRNRPVLAGHTRCEVGEVCSPRYAVKVIGSHHASVVVRTGGLDCKRELIRT